MPKPQLFPLLFAGLVLGMLALITSQFLTSLEHIQKINTESSPFKQMRVALLMEGPTYDQGWNSSALESMVRLQKIYDFSLKIVTNLQADKITETARTFASNGYELIIGHGVVFSEPFNRIAPSYPQTRFISFNGEAFHDNQTSVRFDMKPAGYLVGILAARMSKTGKVGYIAVDKPQEFAQLDGFLEGVGKVAPETKVHIGYVPDFNDVQAALKVARDMIASGVDVIYPTGDSFNLEVISEAQRSKVYTIGYIADQRYIAPDYVLSSMVQDVDQCYRTVIKQFIRGKLPSGTVNFGLSQGVSYFTSFGPMVPQKVRDEIMQELQRLTNPVSHGG